MAPKPPAARRNSSRRISRPSARSGRRSSKTPAYAASSCRDNCMALTLTEFLAQRANKGRNDTALVYADKPVTYAALAAESRRVAQGLAELGVKSGDRVALWLPIVPAWLVCFFACARLGAIAVTVNTRFKS